MKRLLLVIGAAAASAAMAERAPAASLESAAGPMDTRVGATLPTAAGNFDSRTHAVALSAAHRLKTTAVGCSIILR